MSLDGGPGAGGAAVSGVPAAQSDGVAGDHMPNHCSASQASNRSSSVNPSFAARRIEPTLAVWVESTTGSPGSAPANQPSAAAHASAAYPNPHASRQEQVAEIGLPRSSRTDGAPLLS